MWNAILPALLFTLCMGQNSEQDSAEQLSSSEEFPVVGQVSPAEEFPVVGQLSPEEQLSSQDLDKVMPVLLPGLPCDVKDRDRVPQPWRDAYPCVEDSTSDSSSRRNKRHSGWYNYNSKKRNCPVLDQSQVTKGLSTDSADYPVNDIAQCLIVGIIAGRTANTLDSLLQTAVVPGLAPFVNTASLGALRCRNCPTDQKQLFKYTSPTTGTTCWAVQNLNAPIKVNLQCNNRQLCSSSWWAIYHTYQDRCYPEFQTFQVQGYCPNTQGGPCLVTDTLLLPVRCTCRTVCCR